ncbi:MAG: RES family NAD+ phosphorylase [Chthonomonadaceae bacterium]|nr:RES family NAD+ phosphorylase [Chthonomonadaceae bacterium]
MQLSPLPTLRKQSLPSSTPTILYRVTAYRDLLTYQNPLYCGAGTLRGYRYTPIGGPASFYAGVEIETAVRETLQEYHRIRDAWTNRNLPSPLPVVSPITIFSVNALLKNVLDLTSVATQRVLEVTETQLVQEWLPLQRKGEPVFTQELGKAAFDAGFSALRYPSSRHAGNACYVIFPDNFAQGESLTLAGEWETEWHQKGVSSLS